jgi:molybdate transport system regulatory protein
MRTPSQQARRSLCNNRRLVNEPEASMKTSARNHFTGTVKDLVEGPVSTEATITIAGGVDTVATIGARSAEMLGLAVGKPAHALIRASTAVVAVD